MAVGASSTASQERAWRRAQTKALAESSTTEVVAALVDGAFAADFLLEPPGGWGPYRLGQVYELSLGQSVRKGRGAWFTPPEVVRVVIDRAWATRTAPPTVVLDPACGGGAFLLGAVERLIDDGLLPEAAFGAVVGLDLDPDAVAVARAAMSMLAERYEVGGPGFNPTVLAADGLAPWPVTPQVVVGNPPFKSPLRSAPESEVTAKARQKGGLGPYADLAAVFAAAALDRLDPDDPEAVVALVLPQSALTSRDTDALRRGATLMDLWIDPGRPFDAAVHVMAPVLRPGRRANPSGDWAPLAADQLGIPGRSQRSSRPQAPTLADFGVTATAGFRDEYYGLAAACADACDEPAGQHRVVTVGHLDPLVCDWGNRPVRIGGRNYRCPSVAVADLGESLARWVGNRLRPKLLIPTQGRVIEVAVDRAGDWIPMTPVVSVEPDPEMLDRVAAVLLAPPVVAEAAERVVGAALHPGAIKLSARQVVALPTPADEDLWVEAAGLVAGGPDQLDAIATLMNEAYGASPEVLAWWRDRNRPVGRAAKPDGPVTEITPGPNAATG